jgi:hypothetical protein
MHADFSPPQPGYELKIPHTVPIIPTNWAVAATVPRPPSRRAIWLCASTAERPAACCAKLTRQSLYELTLFRSVLFRPPSCGDHDCGRLGIAEESLAMIVGRAMGISGTEVRHRREARTCA